MPIQVNQILRKMKKKESTSYFVTNKANKSVVSSAVRMLFSLFSFYNDLSLADGLIPSFHPQTTDFIGRLFTFGKGESYHRYDKNVSLFDTIHASHTSA